MRDLRVKEIEELVKVNNIPTTSFCDMMNALIELPDAEETYHLRIDRMKIAYKVLIKSIDK